MNNLFNSNKKNNNSLFKIIRIVIIVIVAIYAIRFIMGLFNNSNNSNYTNNYIENHTVSHETDTNSDDVDYNESSGSRDKYTKIIGNNQDDVTVMVYMIGTDLESSYGMATADINEMLYAEIKGNINIVLETGGCSRWKNNVISNKNLERYTINANGFSKLQTLNDEPMTKPETLSSFIKYCADNFPANRNILILWDHGGGSETGYGYDEKYPNYGSLSPVKISDALKEADVKFDFIGFDACLMANLETALALEPYADYLIGSEETEPGEGWYYTNWVKKIDDNTSIKTVDLAKTIIDDYVSSSKSSSRNSEITQSIIDLGELAYQIKKPITAFSKSVLSALKGSDYQKIANARYNTKEFSRGSNLDQVDLVDLALKFNVDGSKELVEAIKNSVKYNKTYNISDAYGLSAYFPYSSLSKVNSMIKIYDRINMDKDYSDVVKSFASYASSGQIVTNNSGSSSSSIFDLLLSDSYNYPSDDYYSNDNIYDILFGSYSGNDYYGYGYEDAFGSGYDDWLDDSYLDDIFSFFRTNSFISSKSLKTSLKDGKKVISLNDEEWNQIESIKLNILIDDHEGYIDLGLDNVFEFNKDGDLIVDCDGTWLSINDHVVSYYMTSDIYISEDDYKTTGYIPAYLNNQRVEIIVNFTNDNPYGVVLGAKTIYKDNDIIQKGLIEIKEGDTIKFVCNYYGYDGSFIDEYQLGDELIVGKQLELNNIHLNNDYVYTYCLEDVYANKLYTEKVVVKK